MKTNFKLWIKAALIRAAKTVAQTAISTLGMSAMISEVNWLVVLSASAMSGILSILTSITGLPEVEKEKQE
ncbi:MAG: holin [Clostridia bacterium]|nr:holin [Clostridia bacterium]